MTAPFSAPTAEAFRRLVESVGDEALLLLDTTGCIASWNRGAEQIFGHSSAAAIGQSLALLESTGGAAPLSEALRQLDTVGTHEGKCHLQRCDGSHFAAEFTLATLATPDDTIRYALTIRDVDAARQLEQQLRESEERYRNLVELAPDCIAVIQNNKAVYVNQAGLAAMKAGGLDEVIGKALNDYLHPEDLPASRERQDVVLHEHRVLALHHVRIRRLDGQYIDVETCAGPCMFNGAPAIQLIARDVTQRIQAVEMNRRRDAFRETVIRTAAEGICVCFAIDEFPYVRFTVWNDQMRLLTGYTMDEINQLGWYQSLYPDEAVRQRAIDRMSRMRTGDDMQAEPWEITRQDGARRWVSISTSQVETEDGRPAVVAMIHDITERRQLEHQLQQSQKLEAIGRLAGGIAHDFNNLLSVIFNYSHLLLDTVGTDDPRRPQIEAIRDAGERAANLTRQLLAFSRQQPQTPTLLDLNAFITTSAGLLQRLVGDSAQIMTRLQPRLSPVRVARGQLEQVLMNLVINARDAMPQGGTIEIATEALTLADDTATARQLPPGPYARLTVHDTGEGIPNAIQSRIFEPFFTTKEIGRGTGLGLAVVHGIVQQCGGQISFTSRPGEGTTFEILYPVVLDELPASSAITATIAPRGSETLLVVDDEPGVRHSISLALSGLGYRVLTAANAAEATELANQQLDAIALLVADVNMPGMNGPELAARLCQRRPQLRVLFMSGYIDRARFDAWPQSRSPLLQKPFTLIDLAQAVRQAIDA